MKRTERLNRLIAELRAAAPHWVPVPVLADRLGVAPATVERYVRDLRDDGVAVLGARRFGYALPDPGALPSPAGVVVSPRMFARVVAGGGPRAALVEGPDARVLLFRRRDEPPLDSAAAAVAQAVATGRVVTIRYVDSAGERSVREVEPAGLLRGVDGWYLVGWCRLRGDARSFRLDRVTAAWPTDEPAPAHVIRDLVPDVPVGCRGAAR